MSPRRPLPILAPASKGALCLHRFPSRLEGRVGRRGFTLIEVMVVVVIITVLAALAIPQITLRMRDRRTQQVAHEVSSLYRDARARAMGRGAAVLVRYSKTQDTRGWFQMREAVLGGGDNCAPLPNPACLTAGWATGDPDPPPDDQRILTTLNPGAQHEGMQIDLFAADGTTPISELDICFSPLGRAFTRQGALNAGNPVPFAPLVQTPSARVRRNNSDGDAIGLERFVMLLPNGAARLAL